MTRCLFWGLFENYLEQIARPDKPVPPDIGIVRAMMLWPDDMEMREQSATRAFFDYLDDLGDAPSDVKNFAYKLARSAIGALELEKREDERIPRGLFVGSVLYSMATCDNDENFNFNYHVENCNKLFLQKKNHAGKRLYRFSKKTFDNELWPTFRSVAQYWATSFKILKIDNGDEFPCALDNLQDFLAFSEYIRAKAEIRRPFKSPSTILRPGEALTIPSKFVTKTFLPS
jgi:hypothetical protein